MTYKIKVGHIISKIGDDANKFKVFMISESYMGTIYHLINMVDNTHINVKKEDLKNWKKETI